MPRSQPSPSICCCNQRQLCRTSLNPKPHSCAKVAASLLSPGIQLAPSAPSSKDPSHHLVKVSTHPAKAWPEIAPLWARLAEASPHTSFYLTVNWVSAWLEIFGPLLNPQVLVFEEQDNAVGICLLNSCLEKRGPFRVRRLYLNTGGEDPADRTLMEFNNLVCRPGHESAVAQALASHVDSLPWHEFAVLPSPPPILPGCSVWSATPTANYLGCSPGYTASSGTIA